MIFAGGTLEAYALPPVLPGRALAPLTGLAVGAG